MSNVTQENRFGNPFNICDIEKEKIIMARLLAMQKLKDKVVEEKDGGKSPSRHLNTNDGPGI